jgi:predicted nucleic acid-binding protein
LVVPNNPLPARKMTIGIDTSFLVAWAVKEHEAHHSCRLLFTEALDRGETFAITAEILAEFTHVVTDPRRFQIPLTMAQAIDIADHWQQSAEVVVLSSSAEVIRLWLEWLGKYSLGRKRLLDTLIAATWHLSGVKEVFTLNSRDFAIFDCFTCKPGP